MDLRKAILTANDCYKAGAKLSPRGIMWHSTGANNPNLKRYVPDLDGRLGVNKYNNHWNQAKPGGRNVCVHAFIGLDKDGKIATYQTLPFNMQAWHSGSNTGNARYIGFEICEDDLTDKEYFNAVYKEAVEFTAYLCETYNLDPMGKDVIICHQDGYKLGIASNHSDVYPWFKKMGKTMDDVRQDVKKVMSGSVKPAPVTPDPEPEKKVDTPFKVRVSIKDLNIRVGAGTNYSINFVCPPGVYTIVEVKSGKGSDTGWGRLKSGAGWISLDYVKRV